MDLPFDLVAAARPDLVLELAAATFDVREFEAREALHRIFEIDLTCLTVDPNVDFEAVVGAEATFRIRYGQGERVFRGLINECEQLECEVDGLSSYRLRLVPAAWLATQNRNYRVFQLRADPDVAVEVLSAWEKELRPALGETHRPRKYRVQYAESDFAFASRLLEDAGVTFFFATDQEGNGEMVFTDGPHEASPRAPLPFVDQPTELDRHDFVTKLVVERKVLPGRYTQEDVDYRLPPTFPLTASAAAGSAVEDRLEVRHYNPGSFLFDGKSNGDTPTADDRGVFRSDPAEGARQAQKRLDAKRSEVMTCGFETSALDVRPGTVLSVDAHPSVAVGDRWLVTASTLSGSATGAWRHHCRASRTDRPFRPALTTPKPVTRGLESATVVGPSGDEIHADELGRVRVHFHWDRFGPTDEQSSCWVPVSQPWGGTSFGGINVPRIGQEVLVEFLNGDPDRPLVIGRVFTKDNPVPYDLPQFKDVQGIRSESTPKLPLGVVRSGLLGGAPAGGGDGAGEASPRSSPLGGGKPFALDVIDKLVSASRYFTALSPDGSTHQWSGSELMMHDTRGQEKMYLQAQKDFHKVVKNNQISVVGHSKAESIATDDVRYVTNKESFTVADDRTGMVGGLQRELIQEASYKESINAGQHHEAAESFVSRTTDHRFESSETFAISAPRIGIKSHDFIHLRCQDSQITMKADGVLIQGAITHLNPGDAFAARTLQGYNLAISAMLAPLDQRKADAAKAFADADAAYGPNSEYPSEDGRMMTFAEAMAEKGYDPGEAAQAYHDLSSGAAPSTAMQPAGEEIGI